ncbi:MAG: SRPBCC domain-containing protein [Lewinella sp.]
METLTFTTNINAPARLVWGTITDPTTYQEWTGAAFPGSRFEGEWVEGKDIRFVGEDGSGTLVHLHRVEPYRMVESEHIALLQAPGTAETRSEQASSWIGTRENYYLEEDNGATQLRVEMHTPPEWVNMFQESWPVLLNKLKEMCEHTSVIAPSI